MRSRRPAPAVLTGLAVTALCGRPAAMATLPEHPGESRFTDIDDMMTIADRDEVMPPKSTWFDPKIRSGLFMHRFATAGPDGTNPDGRPS
jgi:hypothetical protein